MGVLYNGFGKKSTENLFAGIQKAKNISLNRFLYALGVRFLGEIVNNVFLPGFTKKPSFKSAVRIITMNELALILGEQQINNNDQIGQA